MIAGDGRQALGRAYAGNDWHFAMDETLVHQYVGAARGADQLGAVRRVAAEDQLAAVGFKDEAVGELDRLVPHGDRAHDDFALVEHFSLGEFRHLDLERSGRGPALVRDALLQLETPERHESVDMAPRPGRAEEALRTGASLMPA